MIITTILRLNNTFDFIMTIMKTPVTVVASILLVITVAEHYWSSLALPPHSSIHSRKKKGPGVPRQLAFSKGKE
jgi:hypothetical protein